MLTFVEWFKTNIPSFDTFLILDSTTSVSSSSIVGSGFMNECMWFRKKNNPTKQASYKKQEQLTL